MSRRDERREQRAARRDDLSGAGPVREERPAARFPGAGAKFGLLGEVLLIGLLIAVVGIVVVTLPAGLAAGMRHLRRFIRAEGSQLHLFWHDVRAALAGGALVGIVASLIALVLAFDIVLASTGVLPGGPVVAAVGWAGLAALGVVLLASAANWAPETGWGAAVRSVPASVGGDPVGALYLAATVGFVGVVTWMLAPLLVPALGCAALAAVAVPHRGGR